MTFDYHTYLASREWAQKREAVRNRCGNVCERCHRAPHQQTHHLTYARVGHERLEDLLGVCKRCHKFLSAKSNVDPAKQKRKIRLASANGSGGEDRLLIVARELNAKLTTWWPNQLYDHKGTLFVFSRSWPSGEEERIVISAWRIQNEYEHHLIVNGEMFENDELKIAPSWLLEVSGTEVKL